ncbi:odorant receptor 131-2-like [Melanotaenia boesemani]|uniref:odorant receptor 131-2-like n=1 Tax=Melanotaenia boesemani TaxID=1250792 RepID=UPI001C04A2E9|nr:odorant receptor 131-2-like [Melanotaenia boesemani]
MDRVQMDWVQVDQVQMDQVQMDRVQSPSNTTDELLNQGLLRISIISTMSTVPSFVFLYINGTMLYILRSKPVFRETCRYILLYNLLLADTVQLAQSQAMFLLSVCRIKLAYSLCIVLSMFANLTTGISPLTLLVMPLERYVAVCYPLRYASIATIRNTVVAVSAIWAVSSLNSLTRSLLFLQFPFEKMASLQLQDVCSNIALVLGYLTDEYDRAYTCVLFVSAGVAVTVSYFGVIIAARSASTDKVLARKARNTLLLHLVQLGLSLSSTINNPLLTALSRISTKMVLLWVQNVFYVCFIIFPRCLSSLIYGLRDQTIRPVLVYHLYCRLKVKISG